MRRFRVPPQRTRALRVAMLAALALLGLTVVPSSFGIIQLDSSTTGRLPDVDTRAGVKPTAAQLRAAKALHAHVSWNTFGTPSRNGSDERR